MKVTLMIYHLGCGGAERVMSILVMQLWAETIDRASRHRQGIRQQAY